MTQTAGFNVIVTYITQYYADLAFVNAEETSDRHFLLILFNQARITELNFYHKQRHSIVGILYN